MPKVSVVIPAYNAMTYLPETVESVLKQTFSNFEVSLFCHFPLSRMISNSQKQGMLSDAEFGNRILTSLASSRISTQKKLRDRLLCLCSRIQEM